MGKHGGWRWGASGKDGPTGKIGKYGPQVEWNGRLWSVDRTGYYRHAKGQLLHRAVWEAAHGPIPSRLEIHHRDGNRQNFALANLEAVTRSEHVRIHPRQGIVHMGFSEHGSVARSMWSKRQPISRTCEWCGKQFESTGMRTIYCSRSCCKKFYYHRDAARRSTDASIQSTG